MAVEVHIVVRLFNPETGKLHVDGYSEGYTRHQLTIPSQQRNREIPVTIQQAMRNYLVHGMECEVVSVLHRSGFYALEGKREWDMWNMWGSSHFERNQRACAGQFKQEQDE